MPRIATLAGNLLVATFDITDRNFYRAVVLVLAHDAGEGTAGLVLNRPTGVQPPDRLDVWRSLATAPAVMFNGGPVGRDTLIAIAVAHDDRTPLGWQPVHGRLGVLDLHGDAALAGGDLTGMRLFAGYAGWEGGQLAREIAAGAWFVVAAQPDDVLTAAPGDLWRAVLARQGGLLTTVPLDPNLN
jgi:putative transcriptional regulator